MLQKKPGRSLESQITRRRLRGAIPSTAETADPSLATRARDDNKILAALGRAADPSTSLRAGSAAARELPWDVHCNEGNLGMYCAVKFKSGNKSANHP